MRISRRIFIVSTFSFFISILIKFIFFNSESKFIYLKKYLKEAGYKDKANKKANSTKSLKAKGSKDK